MPPSLQAFEVTLQNLNGPLPIAAVRANALNGLFHTMMGPHLPQLHDEARKPFSLAPRFDARRNAYLGFRVGTLTAEMGQCVAEVWGTLAHQQAVVRLGPAHMQVQAVQAAEVGPTSFEQLIEDAPAAHRVRLRFETPVVEVAETARGHKHKGLFLPTPGKLWKQYLRVWEAHTGREFPCGNFAVWVERAVLATDATLDTHCMGGEREVLWKGLMGEVEYQAYTDGDDLPTSRVPEYLRAWQGLARLAEYCGTGAKTTMGLGRTRVVSAFGQHYQRGGV